MMMMMHGGVDCYGICTDYITQKIHLQVYDVFAIDSHLTDSEGRRTHIRCLICGDLVSQDGSTSNKHITGKHGACRSVLDASKPLPALVRVTGGLNGFYTMTGQDRPPSISDLLEGGRGRGGSSSSSQPTLESHGIRPLSDSRKRQV